MLCDSGEKSVIKKMGHSVVLTLQRQPVYQYTTVYISPTWIKTHHITALGNTLHKLSNFNSKNLNNYPFLIYIYITYKIEIIILNVIEQWWHICTFVCL
jgi:hypothetical protein